MTYSRHTPAGYTVDMSELHLSPVEEMGFRSGSPFMSSISKVPDGTSDLDWRYLTPDETGILEKNGNQADDWKNLQVMNGFSADRVRDCRFYGPVYVGSLGQSFLEFHDLRLPVGLYSSTIVSCNIGSDVALHNVSYISRTAVEDKCLIFNVNEIITTDHAKFGNGVVMDGENEEVRIWLEIANENGGRKVLPFDGMLPADAWIWSKYRSDDVLMTRFMEMTGKVQKSSLGDYGHIGSGTVIKDCRIIKDVKIGESAYIKGCNKLKNLTINSDAERSTQLGEGCELVNGIIGYGCRIFYGVKAVRFILNDHSTLKYGARLINSVLGSNSTISCCEVLNSLIFGSHEQHHNSSFLCASTLMGQTNIASAATVGSNHNSRASDGEIVADRGFWPGLSVSLKHNSRFAAFTLIAKGAYPAELDIRLPFSLVNNDETIGELQLMPGYWFRYNMYALARSASKTAARDKRKTKCQELEFDWLAPDTIQQMLEARDILESWAGESKAISDGSYPSGKAFLESDNDLELFAGADHPVENGKRPVRVLHAGRGWRDYGRMIRYWCIRELLIGKKNIPGEMPFFDGEEDRRSTWLNLGGQLIRKEEMERLKDDIREQKIGSWRELHEEYSRIGNSYVDSKQSYALEVLKVVAPGMNRKDLVAEARETAEIILDGILESRRKDYTNHFRSITFDNSDERDAVIGKFDENDFIREAEGNHHKIMELLK